MGGTQSLHTNSFDEALSLPSDDSAKLALRTQQIIAHETNIPNYPDPFGGSHLIEEMTESYIEKSFKIIEKINSIGGAIEAIETGWIENQISRSSYEYQKNVDNKTNIVIGVNKHKDEAPKNIETFNIDIKSADKQIKSLKTYKENRNNLEVNERLNNLKVIAKSNNNIMPAILDCVRNHCTLGEIWR